MSVIRTLIVTIDSVIYAVADSNVERMVRIDNYEKRIETINNSLVLILNGRIIPIVTMGEIAAKAKGKNFINHNKISKCLVLKANGKNFAIAIDDAEDIEQILVKPVPSFLQNCPCYSNVTVLGDGRAVMILDPDGIMRYMNIDADVKITEKVIENVTEKFIVFTCSGTEHFAIDADCVSRIETINTQAIEKVGEKYYATHNGKTFRLIHPENFIQKQENYNEKKLYILIIKKTNISLLVKKVLDMTDGIFVLDREQISNEYILGTSIINKKIVIVLNPKTITEKPKSKKRAKRIKRVHRSKRNRVVKH